MKKINEKKVFLIFSIDWMRRGGFFRKLNLITNMNN